MTLLKALRVRASQGTQYIPDLRAARPPGFRGLPLLPAACPSECAACVEACPTRAIQRQPLRLDLGRCVFCDACVRDCPEQTLRFSAEPKMAASSRAELVVAAGASDALRVRANAGFAKLFGRSLRLRQVSSGGCNACELELAASANVNFDVQRFGIDWVASPRHADALVLTGPLTRNMKSALESAWSALPAPRFLVAVGACAISGGLFEAASGVDRSFLESVAPALYVPGCPPHPLTFVNALLDFLDVP